jgi:antirestriction protein ArdC
MEGNVMSKYTNNDKKSVYEMVTEKIVSQLDEGVVPWRKPWIGGGPANFATGHVFRGINTWMLNAACSISGYKHNQWLTLKQCNKKKGRIKKGEHGEIVVFWKMLKRRDKETGEDKTFPLLQYTHSFNVSQCTGLDLSKLETASETVGHKATADEVVSLYVDNGGPSLVETGEGVACYSPTKDRVTMPMRQSFLSMGGWYSTLFHEMSHSTGHQSRLARVGVTQPIAFASHNYSKEELIAEMGAAMLCGMAGVEPEYENSAAYIQTWRNRLEYDPKMIVQAGAAAQKAADWVLGQHEDNQLSVAA